MFQEWRRNIGVEGVAYREAAERVAAKASMDFQELGFLGAMDYSKAHDKMDPWISGRAMEETGIPGNLVRTLFKVWKNQERWVQFDRQLGKEALRTAMAHPRGGPWGPAVMQLWMAGGALRIKEKEKEKEEEFAEAADRPPATKRRKATGQGKNKGKGAAKGEEFLEGPPLLPSAEGPHPKGRVEEPPERKEKSGCPYIYIWTIEPWSRINETYSCGQWKRGTSGRQKWD